MREILFRGKDIAGNWHYGVPLVFTEDYVCMTAPHTYNKKVEANTVGQFTGLIDKNGAKVFEGDILKGSWETVLTIFYDEISLSYRVKTSTGHEREPSYYDIDKWEIIGNIHDNPELLRTPQNDEVRE